MTALLGPLAVLVLVAMAGWVAGAFLLRAGGLLLVVVALLTLAAGDGLLGGLGGLGLGTVVWLAGYWLHAFRRHEYRSPLAGRIFRHALPRLDRARR